ncbi:MAG TPA: glycosyl hydrolase family 28-related protein [Capsulimonadaceae bacterium]|jgi:hypothetical protein
MNYLLLRTIALVVTVFASLAVSSAANFKPRIVPTKYQAADYVVATVVLTEAPYSADATGGSDCTVALQRAIDDVAAVGGGVVFAPAGRYRFNGGVTVKEGVTVRGDWKEPKGGDLAVGGTILMPYGGRGNAVGLPFVTLQRGTGLRNVSVWYPEQVPANIVPYPWTVGFDKAKRGDNYTVQQVTLVNSYQGISTGTEWNELPTFRDVYGSPLKTGIFVDTCADICRIARVRFSPDYWLRSGLGDKLDDAAVRGYVRSNGVAIDMARSDWQYIYDTEIAGYRTGISVHAGVNNRASCGVMYGVTVAGGEIGVSFDKTVSGWCATDCKLTGDDTAVDVLGGFSSDLQLNHCDLRSQRGPAVRVGGRGAVRLENCTLQSAQSPGMTAQSGYVTVISSHFPAKGVQLTLAAPVKRALVVGSLGKASVANSSNGDIQIESASVTTAIPRSAPLSLPPDGRPATDKLFVVTDFGAVADGDAGSSATDNTVAFQKALDAAGVAGGGTVYVPAGSFRFAGSLRVPSGVELRGVFDVPHHTWSWGSTLMPIGGRGDENGTPFITLAANSGARGLTVWYPDQKADNVVAYPWTVHATGPKCRLIDFTTANSYKLADFGSVGSEGHLLRYVAGAPLKVGIWVAKGGGETDSCQFNPHYWTRRPATAPSVTNSPAANATQLAIAYPTVNLDAFVFGGGAPTLQVNNFVYGVNRGLVFDYDGARAPSAIVINHGTDGCTVGASILASARPGIDLINTEIATVGPQAKHILDIGPECSGPVMLSAGFAWGRNDIPAMRLTGTGSTTVQLWNYTQQQTDVGGGDVSLEGVEVLSSTAKHVVVGPGSKSMRLVANAARAKGFVADKLPQVREIATGAAMPPVQLVARFATGFEAGQAVMEIVPAQVQAMVGQQCAVKDGAGRTGAGVVLTGDPATIGKHAYTYFTLATPNIDVRLDTVLRYAIKPLTPDGVHCAADLVFADGSVLRDMGASDIDGTSMHPGVGRGSVGAWTGIECAVGAYAAGKTIAKIQFAYDSGVPGGPIACAVDDIEIGEPKAVSK